MKRLKKFCNGYIRVFYTIQEWKDNWLGYYQQQQSADKYHTKFRGGSTKEKRNRVKRYMKNVWHHKA